MTVKIPARVLYASRNKAAGAQAVKPVGLIAGDKLGVSVDPSDCDDANAPQKVLMSSSTNRVWGDPTTFGILELE